MNGPPTGERNVLVEVAGRAQEVADLVEGSAEAMSRIEVLEVAHRVVASFDAPVILFQHVIFVLTDTVVDVRAEFLGDGLGIAGVLSNRALTVKIILAKPLYAITAVARTGRG